MKLTVVEHASSLKESLLMEKQWDNFFTQIIEQVRDKTNPGVVDEFECNFTTTTQIHQVISTAIIMNSFKKYFSYERMICYCGINNVYFEGVREDWIKLLEKTLNLKKYDVDNKLIKYIDSIEIILNQFIKTYDNDVDVKF